MHVWGLGVAGQKALMQQVGRECIARGSQRRRERKKKKERQLPAVRVQLIQGKAK